MKALFVTLLATFTLTATAQSYVNYLEGLSWNQLRNEEVDLEGDTIWFGGHQKSVLDICQLDAKTVRTKRMVTIEEQDGDDFVVVGRDYLYKSINYTSVMVDGDGTMDVPATVALSYDIDVHHEDDDFEGEYLFTKSYQVPACN